MIRQCKGIEFLIFHFLFTKKDLEQVNPLVISNYPQQKKNWDFTSSMCKIFLNLDNIKGKIHSELRSKTKMWKREKLTVQLFNSHSKMET